MLKIFFLLVISASVCKAQFVGSYSLRDGGVDMMSSGLSVLPDNQFAISTYSGVIFGTWKEVDKNKIVLTDERSGDSFFKVYAGSSTAPAHQMKFNFTNFDKANALISLSSDTLRKAVFQPVFDSNSFYGDYSIAKPTGSVKYIKLAFSPPAAAKGVEAVPDKFYVYTFTLPETFNTWYIVFNADGLNAVKPMELKKEADVYTLNNKTISDREELTDKVVQDIRRYKMQMERPVSRQRNNRYKDIPDGTKNILANHLEIIQLENNSEKALFPPKHK